MTMFTDSNTLLPKNDLCYEYKTLMIDSFDETDCENLIWDYYIVVHTEWLNFIIVIPSNKYSNDVFEIFKNIKLKGEEALTEEAYKIKFDSISEETKDLIRHYLSFNSMYMQKCPAIKELILLRFIGWRRHYPLNMLKEETDNYLEKAFS